VEGRFPYLDADVMEFCSRIPSDHTLPCLNEKYILKNIARGRVPDDVIDRPKQPYRAPDTVSFLGQDAPEYVEEMFSEESLKASGVFKPQAVRAFFGKCVSRRTKTGAAGIFSNADNMGFVGILSTQLVFDQFINGRPPRPAPPLVHFTTAVDMSGDSQ